MADNYIEKQMEDFLAGRIGKNRTGAMPQHKSAVNVSADFPPKRILVACRDFADTEATVKLFRSTGSKVAFIAPQGKEASQLAETAGARLYPVTPDGENGGLSASQAEKITANIIAHWRGIDLVAGNLPPFVNK